MTPAPPFDAVVFDCDGVLVDSEVIALEVELAALASAGLTYELGEYKTRFMGMSTAAFHAAADEDSRTKLGRGLPAEFRDLCRAQYRVRSHRLAEVPGARKAVEDLFCPKAVASSSTAIALEEKLRATDLWDLFYPHVYSADHVTHAKPAPDLFLHAARALGVEPARCLVLEDTTNGVTAARAAGMTVWGFTGGGHMDEEIGRRLLAAGATKLVSDWPAASELFDSL